MKSSDPTNPPTMVKYSVEPKSSLNICIRAKRETTNSADTVADEFVGKAEKEKAYMY